jgi:hypothetical protein
MARRYFIVNLRVDELKLIEDALGRADSNVYEMNQDRIDKLRSKIRSIRERIESRQAKERHQTLAAKGNYNV